MATVHSPNSLPTLRQNAPLKLSSHCSVKGCPRPSHFPESFCLVHLQEQRDPLGFAQENYGDFVERADRSALPKVSQLSKLARRSLFSFQVKKSGSEWCLTYRDIFRKSHSLTFRDYARLIDRLSRPDFYNQIETESPFLSTHKLTVAEACESYLSSQIHLRRKTRQEYRKQLSRFVASFRDEEVQNLHPHHIQKYLCHRGEILTPATRYSEFILLRAFFRWLAERGEIRLSPVSELRVLRPRFVPPNLPVSPEEELQLLASMNQVNSLTLLLLLDCGLSLPVLRALEWSHFDFQNHLVTVYYPVSKAHVTLPLSTRLFDALETRRLSQLAYQSQLHPRFAKRKQTTHIFSPFWYPSFLYRPRKSLRFGLNFQRLRNTFARKLLDATHNPSLVEYCTGSSAWKRHRFNGPMPPSVEQLREIFARMEQSHQGALERTEFARCSNQERKL
jgi:integrase